MLNEKDETRDCNLPDQQGIRTLNEDEDEHTAERSSISTPEKITCDSPERNASVHKYEEEWAQLYRRDDPDLGELRRRAVLGNLRASRFRSVCWRCLLGVFSPDTTQWLSQLRQQRHHYAEVLKELSLDPWHRSQPEDNPLSQKAESIWHQYFCDKELQAVIRQDVIRTFPGVDFFRKEMIQDAMVNILFCYARENPAMCYRQGMHEILAPLLFVLHCDHQALLHTREQVTVSGVTAEVLDPTFIQEDAYTIFCRIMCGIESCYRINDLTPTPTGYFPANIQSPFGNGSQNQSENEVVAQLNWIRDNLLAPADPQLYEHLQQLDIPLPLFGIRWLRLLFGREFPLQDLLVLWDAIFAEGENFELVNYIVVAMLIAIKYQLLNGDYTTCMTYLMRYPGAVDITYIIEHALFLRDPQKYCLPAMTSFPKLPMVTVGGRTDLNRAAGQHTGVADKELPKKVSQTSQGASLSGRLKKLSKRPDHWLGGKHTQKGGTTGGRSDADATIVDGYTLDDPALLRAEVQHAHAIMSLCRMKLLQYHSLLQRSFPPTASAEAMQAVDGLQELCSLLKSHSRLHKPLEVEPAYEAGETRIDKQSVMVQRAVSPPTQLALCQNQEKQKMAAAKRKDVRMPPPKSDVDMKLLSITEGLCESVHGAPSKDPLGTGYDTEGEPPFT
ncbi:TBC1 domain family member 5 isoform X2 [Zootermopsis nevadensis]|uniref:TBC1 domain family member 5 n=1 Tax=Zootermopsis nevadensis TaxID=136037 RepID=A0A067RW36_ZOONE|nr:TBC1 domain family member 5 isoform X2 [Zootermopsis nevadensis]KDR24084.1 TBC1 domain family member 5 [Zootermopsis nevadensis]